MRSMASTSRPSITCLASDKNCAACDMICSRRYAWTSDSFGQVPRVSSSPHAEPIS